MDTIIIEHKTPKADRKEADRDKIMADTCSVCGIQFIKGGSYIKNRALLCPACSREYRAMLGEAVPLEDFSPSELKGFLSDPSTCPSPIPYYKKTNPNGCCVCGRSDVIIEQNTKDKKPLCRDCVQNYVTVSNEYYLDPSGFASKHPASYFEEVMSGCIRPRHDIIFNFVSDKIFVMQTNNNTAYHLLRFEDVTCIDNGVQKYLISSDDKGRPQITAFVAEKEIPLSDSPAFTVKTAGSGFRYESNRGQRLLKVIFRSKDNEYYYYIKDQADRSYEYDKTFGTFLRMIRKLKEKADLAELNEKEELQRKEMERQACLELERQQAELKEKQEEERKRAEEQEKEKLKAPPVYSTIHRNTVKDLMLQRNDMRPAMPSAPAGDNKTMHAGGSYGSLIELRKLLDAGIITEEEFSAKKKQILGI